MTTALAPTPAPAFNPLPTPPADLLVEILTAAADFADHEWTQLTYGRAADGTPAQNFLSGQTVQFCADGHLLRAVERIGGRDFATGPLYAALAPGLPEDQDLVRWNDTPGRRPEEVRQLFREAAVRAPDML